MIKRYGIIGCGMMGQEHLRNINLINDAMAYAIYRKWQKNLPQRLGFMTP